MKAILNALKKVPGLLKRWLLDDFWLKVFSLVLALGLWSYVLTNDSTITRERTLTNLYVTVSNQSTFDSRDFAVVESLSDTLPQVRVSVEVTQSDYYKITSNNVRVELDLSRVRETGEQTVPLTASTVYGEVTGIYPDSVTINVDELEKRNVQVEVQLKGADTENKSYSQPTSNPSIITISGPKSLVEQVTNARAVMDLTDVTTTGTITRAVSFTLLDEDQNEVSYPTLSLSSSSVITSVDIYPQKSVPVETDQAKILTGSVPSGYQIDSVEVQPAEIAVAGSQKFLDSLDTVQIYSINVSNMRTTTTKSTRVNRQSDMRSLSTEEVMVTIHISEKELTRTIEKVSATLKGTVEEGLTAEPDDKSTFSVTVTGPYSQITALERSNITLYADVSGLKAGTHDVPLECVIEGGDELQVEIEPATVEVTVEAGEAGEAVSG